MTRAYKFMAAAAAAATLMGVANAASATNYTITLTALPGGSQTGGFSATVVGTGPTTFSDTFNFTLAAPGSANATITTILLNGLNNLNFTVGQVLLDGLIPFNVVTGGSSAPDTATLTATNIGAGAHTIVVNGSIAAGSTGGSYAGVLNVAPVPEPATWAMMILGMGMVGMGLRMRRRAVAAFA